MKLFTLLQKTFRPTHAEILEKARRRFSPTPEEEAYDKKKQKIIAILTFIYLIFLTWLFFFSQ